MEVSGKKIVVTGAASGIGKELVMQLSNTNNKILAVDLNGHGLNELKQSYGLIDILCLDLGKNEDLKYLFEWLHSQWGNVDIFFANAGSAHYGPWEDFGPDDLERMMKINTLAPMVIAQWLQQYQKKPFRLVVTASAMSHWPVPGYAGYAASKAALHQFAETIRSEGGGDWLTIVYPGSTDTAFFNHAGRNVPKALPIQSVDSVVRRIIDGVTLGKRRIYPSRIFRLVMLLNRILPIFKPIYFSIERRKLRAWKGK